MSSALVVIPARYASTRLPAKALLRDTGKYLVQHVFERCRMARTVGRVLVATDDPRIAAACASFGAEAVLTSPEHPSGTDRVAEVAAHAREDIVLNVQGDEPQIDARDLDALVEALREREDADMATLGTPLASLEQWRDPNVVKIVCGDGGRVLYFSRSPIPHGLAEDSLPRARKHRGVYAYRRSVLLDLARRPPVPLEVLERLEQLRALFHGYRILVLETPREGIEVNTPEDYRRFVEGAAT
jgi:3-deoxy-manno-octulosonate cytidylyltransferase (CMP-KDO synthetase)